MLEISKALNATQAQDYHKLDYTSPTQSYYAQGDAVKGEWQGKLAESMGVYGEVSATEFSRLTEGQHPVTGETMVRHRIATEYTNPDGSTTKAVAHRAGWDAMFAPTKSVSLTALVGGDERIREAHRAAVTLALDELEKYTHARLGGSKPAEQTGKFLVAKFEHDTARPVDGYAAPQLHTHAVIFNVTQRTDGTTRALQEQPFFESQNFVTAVYQSELMYQLRSLGYEIEPGESGAPEIKGYSSEYLKASSQRRERIKQEMERRGVSGPEAAEIAARSTREKKHTLTPSQVLAAHQEVAAEYGNQPARVIAAARERAHTERSTPDVAAYAKEAVTYARTSLFEREAVLDERALLRDSLRRGMGLTTYPHVLAEFEARQKRGDFISVEAHKYASTRSFTTPETVAAERANITYVQSGRNAVAPMMSAEDAQQQARSRDFHNDSQRQVIEEVLNSPDRIHGLQGRAGTGKSSVLQTIREGAEKNAFIVEGFAPTSRAAAQLREAGIDATTLQSFLARGNTDRAPDARHLYMLDESSLASTRQMQEFLGKLTPKDHVLVVGDTAQHQGVDAGRPFQQMQEAGMKTSLLDRIMRQKDPELLRAVEHLSKNETREGIALLREQGRITEVSDRRDRIIAIAKDYAARPDNTIVVSPDNRSRQEINDAVRRELQQQGQLAHRGEVFRTLVHRSDMTGADRTWAARYNPGDVVQYASGSKANGIERDAFATVRAVDAHANLLTVELGSGVTIAYDPRRLRGVNVFREQEREFASGDRIQFTGRLRELGIANRDLATIRNIEDGRVTAVMDGKQKRTVTFDAKTVRLFDHGYAVTSHSSQGLTARRVLAHFDTEGPRSLINSRLAYVAISRASEDARIYTNDAVRLGRRLATDVSKTAAITFSQSRSQTDARQVVTAFRQNNVATAANMLQEQGQLHMYTKSEDRLQSVAKVFSVQQERVVVFAPDADERRELTRLIRHELREQGRLSTQSQTLPVWVEKHLSNSRIAASYAPGDQIRFKTGSPREHGIADNSTVIVLSVDAKSNRLTVVTLDGNEINYNPALLRRQTDQSSIFREEQREVAEGERIRLLSTTQPTQFRANDLATVHQVHSDRPLVVRTDHGKLVALSEEEARRIEYAYVAAEIPSRGPDRLIVTGSAEALSKHQNDISRIPSNTRDLSVYTSEGYGVAQTQSIISEKLPVRATESVTLPAPDVSIPGYGRGR